MLILLKFGVGMANRQSYLLFQGHSRAIHDAIAEQLFLDAKQVRTNVATPQSSCPSSNRTIHGLSLENSHHRATSCGRDRLELDCELGEPRLRPS